MARFRDREKALALRKKGMSYSQIKKIIKVSKSTLSIWLKDYPLSEQRVRELRDCESKIEKCRETKRKKKEKRLSEFYLEQKSKIFPLNKRGFFLAGLFLYWGEGSKTMSSSISLSNTDPSVINFFANWIINYLEVPKNKINIQLHLYNDMDIEKELEFWSKKLNFPINQFAKPYIKQNSTKIINHKGSFGHGTCNMRIGNARLSEKILMAIKAVSDRYLNTRV